MTSWLCELSAPISAVRTALPRPVAASNQGFPGLVLGVSDLGRERASGCGAAVDGFCGRRPGVELVEPSL
jgi:hypothetical protein